MKHLLIEIAKLSEKLVLQMVSEGMNKDSAEDAVLVILKEHMEVGNTSNENCRECIMTLKMLLGKYD